MCHHITVVVIIIIINGTCFFLHVKETSLSGSSSSPSPPSVATVKSPLESGNLPQPLPCPQYLEIITTAEQTGNVLLHRSQLIRESARLYLSFKLDLSQEYNSICKHLLQRFPDLRDAIILPGSSCNYVSRNYQNIKLCRKARLYSNHFNTLSNIWDGYLQNCTSKNIGIYPNWKRFGIVHVQYLLGLLHCMFMDD